MKQYIDVVPKLKALKMPIAMAAVMVGLTAISHAQIIGLAFNNGNTLNASTTYGAPGGSSAGWYNNSHGGVSGSDLIDSTDTATTAGWAFTPNGAEAADGRGTTAIDGSQNIGTVATNGIFSGDVYTQYNVVELALTSIPYSSYSIYVYTDSIDGPDIVQDFAGGPQQGSTYYLSDEMRSTSYNLGSTNSSSPSGNYAVFSNLTGASQTIDMATLGQYSTLDAVEIVDTASTAVPEPTTSMMMLLGGLGISMIMILHRRRSGRV